MAAEPEILITSLLLLQIVMSIQSRNAVTTQVAYTWPQATAGDTMF